MFDDIEEDLGRLGVADRWQYAKCAECDRELNKQIMFQLEGTFICWNCIEAHNGPGKFQVHSVMNGDHEDLEALGKCLLIYHWSLDGCEDDFMSTEGWGYCGRFGNYLLYHDSQGFVSFEEYDDETGAEKEFQRLWESGWGADESDAFISFERGRYEVSFDGKSLDVWGRGRHGHPVIIGEGIDEKRCVARVRLEAMKTGYYPSLWMVSDHGNLTLRSY